MSRWAERLKAKYANANSANSADSSPEAPSTDLSAPNGAIGIGISPESEAREVAATPPKRGPNPPAPGGLVARIIEAGGVSRIGGFRPDRGLYKTAELPEDAPAELVEHLKAERWHVARILKAARRATPRPETDPAEWQGEYEVTP